MLFSSISLPSLGVLRSGLCILLCMNGVAISYKNFIHSTSTLSKHIISIIFIFELTVFRSLTCNLTYLNTSVHYKLDDFSVVLR